MTSSEVSKMLSKLIKKAMPTASLFLAEVLEVDKDKCTCKIQPLDDAVSQRLDVRLLPVEKEETAPKGFVCFPALESIVLCANFDQNEVFVISVFEIESVVWGVGESFKLEIDSQGNAVFNDGDNEGLVKAPELKTQIDKNTATLNAILGILNGPIVNEPGNGLPSVLHTALKAAVAGKQTADLSKIQNTKIKH